MRNDEEKKRCAIYKRIWEVSHIRFWNGTNHAGEVRTAAMLSILICIRAKMAKASSAKNPRPYNEASAKYDFRVFLLRLGANGSLFKTMRHHLCKNLSGSAAWKDGRHDRPRAAANAEAEG